MYSKTCHRDLPSGLTDYPTVCCYGDLHALYTRKNKKWTKVGTYCSQCGDFTPAADWQPKKPPKAQPDVQATLVAKVDQVLNSTQQIPWNLLNAWRQLRTHLVLRDLDADPGPAPA